MNPFDEAFKDLDAYKRRYYKTPIGRLKMLRHKIMHAIRQIGNRKITLPCNVGDTAYCYTKELGVEPFIIVGVALKADGWYIIDDDGNMDKIGTQYACMTREEAERFTEGG